MAVVATLKYYDSGYVLSETLETVGDVRLDFAQEMAIEPQRPYLWFWMKGCEQNRFEDAMEADETIAEYSRYTTTEAGSLYRIHLSEAAQIVNYPMWVAVGAHLIDGGYRNGWWRTNLRVKDREALSSVREWFESHEVTFELERVCTDDSNLGSDLGLSTEQRRVLEVALEMGYFDIPRRSDLEDIAEELDISSQAASERLRRGHRHLVSHHL